MSFTTPIFAVFLAIVFGAYWFLPRRGQNILVVLASCFFYGWWDWRFLFLLLGCALVNFYVGRGLARSPRPAGRKILLLVALVVSLGALAIFKYLGFFVDSFYELVSLFGVHQRVLLIDIILPVGISFYTFQSLSYTIDVYRGREQPVDDVVEFLAFVSFFPQLVAGPIERSTALLTQFKEDRQFDVSAAADGCRQMLWGFFQKMVIADSLARMVDVFYGDVAQATGGELLWATYFFAFQIYCDFSGYSHIAIGAAKLFGIQLGQNFATPYFSESPAEFWRRWHISLSTWFRDYLYLPLGGNRVVVPRYWLNIALVFTISGLWHGARWTFVIWGALHALFFLLSPFRPSRTVERQAQALSWTSGLGRGLRILITFHAVCLAWVFFRASSLADALVVLQKIASIPVQGGLGAPNLKSAGLIVLLVLIEWIRRGKRHPLELGDLRHPWRWGIYYALVLGIVVFAPMTDVAFIYFLF